jgi:DNA-binding NtrC family response regulator
MLALLLLGIPRIRDKPGDIFVTNMLIHVPSLNQRKDDIPVLTEHFLHHSALEYNQPTKTIEPGAMQLLTKHQWTGNIRELKNAVERLVVLADKVITKKDIESYILMK